MLKVLGTVLALGLSGCVSPQAQRVYDQKAVDLLSSGKADSQVALGLVTADLSLTSPSVVGSDCSDSTITVTRYQNEHPVETTNFKGMIDAGFYSSVPSPKSLIPGSYRVTAVQCNQFKRRTKLTSEIARFEVKAGEFLNLGRLDVTIIKNDNWITGGPAIVRAAVAPMSEERLARLRKAMPEATARMVDRFMVASPNEITMRSQFGW